MTKPVTAILGVGPGNGAALARRFAREGHVVALASRSTDFTKPLAAELGGRAYALDVRDPTAVANTCAAIATDLGPTSTLIYNAGSGVWGGIDKITATQFEDTWRVNTLGLFAATQATVPAMQAAGAGTILITGATASLRGKPQTTAFASAKAAQRSLAQSLARALWPSNIHVALFIIDGGIAIPGRTIPEVHLEPDHIADVYWQTRAQPATAWSFEVEVRPPREPW